MSHLAFLSRLSAGTVVLLALASACGGKSFEPGGGGDEGGSNTGATSSQAGSRPIAGSSAGGGIGTGGVSSTGGTPSTGGTISIAGTTSVGGSGGSSGEACTAPWDPGPCNAYNPSWYHEASTGLCRPFVYGGCSGNANRYPSLGACQMACRNESPNYDGCTQASDCMITGNSCCGVCDTPSLTKHDFVAYNKKYQGLECSGGAQDAPTPGGIIACPGCPEIMGGFLKYFVPECVQNECVVVDLRDPQFTACMTDDDCTYRLGSGCCQSCEVSDAIPLRKDVSIDELVCGNGPVACAACPPIAPRNVPVPQCGADHRCGLSYLPY